MEQVFGEGDEGVKEDVCLLDEDELDDWADKNIGYERDISDDDDEVWHYLSEVEMNNPPPGNRQSGKMETAIPVKRKPVFR